MNEFKRGIDPKKALDVGIKREGNEKEWIERGLEGALGEFFPRMSGTIRKDGSRHWIDYYKTAWHQTDLLVHMVSIYPGYLMNNWDKRYQKYFKSKAKKWFDDNEFEVTKFRKEAHRDRYFVYFKKIDGTF